MINVTTAFKNAMKAPVKVIKATVEVLDGETYTSADSLVKLEKQATGYFFGVATQSIEVRLLGTNYDLLGKKFDVTLSVLTNSANDTWDDCVLGRFKVVEQTTDLEKEMTTVKAYDAIGIIGSKYYQAGDFVFPLTVNELAERLGIDANMDVDTLELVNGSYQIPEDLYQNINGITHRDILAEIAGASASLASVHGVDSTLTFITPPQTAIETWTYDNLKKVKLEPRYGVVNSVVLARTPQEDNIAVQDTESVAENGLTEVKLANNEILDDNREAMAQPILDAVDDFYFYPFEATTEGHGWHEIGDRIAITDGTNTWEVVITDIKLTIDGSLKEVIKGVAPDDTTTDYALAGGITKTIYNTEIKVDKQGQEITSVVSRQDQLENETLENFTQVVQNISSITTTIQTTGGGNLLHNSVGYNVDSEGNLVNWAKTGTVTADSSPESVSYGALSGNQINLAASSSITQRVAVDTQGSVYSFGFKAKKGATGTATIHLRNTVDDYVITIPANEAVLWESYEMTNLTPHDSYFDIVVGTDSNVTDFAITDLIINVGDSKTPWVPASDEILSKSVAIDSDGVTVRSSTNDDYVQLNELGLNGYHGSDNVFKLQQDVTEVAKLKSRDQITMPPIKIVPITQGSSAGWAFVSVQEES